ncbi:MAG: hypothetical protein GXO86_02700 [Chlorobi bacterium]|nr:hypothetical protein [Chlorobiota bacterium]
MKCSKLLLLALATILFSSGCNIANRRIPQKTDFTGTCTPVKDISPGTTEVLESGKLLVTGQTSEWYDSTNITLVTGQSIWIANRVMEPDFSSAKLWGTAVINVGVKNEGDPVLGKWELIWEATLTGGVFDPETGTLTQGIIKGEACGTGVSGNVVGMVGHWIYTMDFSKGDIYYSTGYIK